MGPEGPPGGSTPPADLVTSYYPISARVISASFTINYTGTFPAAGNPDLYEAWVTSVDDQTKAAVSTSTDVDTVSGIFNAMDGFSVPGMATTGLTDTTTGDVVWEGPFEWKP